MTSSKPALDPIDLFDVRAELSDEERMVQDSVARFVDKQAIPLMRTAFEQHHFPRELIGWRSVPDANSGNFFGDPR